MIWKVLWKYAANLDDNTYAEVRFQQSCKTTCFPVNLLHIFRTPFYKNTSGGLLLLENVFSQSLPLIVKK